MEKHSRVSVVLGGFRISSGAPYMNVTLMSGSDTFVDLLRVTLERQIRHFLIFAYHFLVLNY